MRSEVREESLGEGSGRVLNFVGGVVAGKEDLNIITGLEWGGQEWSEREAWTNGISDRVPLQWQKLSRSIVV
jgi:hypothetical protein